jgi:AraC-like DNA-binding protein
MEAVLEKVTHIATNSFALKEDILPHIKTPWHFHPEYELTLIAESHGRRFIGDHVENFRPGDLIFIGPNLPHFWKNDRRYYMRREDYRVRAIVIHFLENFLGDNFFRLPEMAAIGKLLKRSERGLRVDGQTKRVISDRMELMLKQAGFERFLNLLQILDILSRSKELTDLSSIGYQPTPKDDLQRINQVYEYLLSNYRNDIDLEKVSDLINLSPTAFCRFFKRSTGKTFTQVLNELRIGHACKLLIEEGVSVSEACFSSGYNNLSYFNRKFKSITKLTPLKFVRRIEHENSAPATIGLGL